jgi:hypothetical protein
MSRREKNILALAIVVGIIFVISQVLPSVRGAYASRADSIEQLQTDIERERRLFADADLWQARRADVEAQGVDLSNQLFQEASVPLISASIQRLVREYATQSGISVTSTRLAESMAADGWTLVEQELSIVTGEQSNILRFLQQLESSSPVLGVSAFSLRRNRNQYAGSITVVGFSRDPDAPATGPAG